LPGFVNDAEKLASAGAEVVACVSVNDPFVMAEWGKAQSTEGKVRMIADPRGEFTKAMGFELDLTGALGNIRSQRYACIVEDGVVTHIEVDSQGIKNTTSENMLSKL